MPTCLTCFVLITQSQALNPNVKESRTYEMHVVSKELPHVNEVVPIKWLRYENVLRVLKEKDHKFISLSTAKKIASKFCNINDSEVQTVLTFLHDLRILIHFVDDSPELSELVILDIQWLIDESLIAIMEKFSLMCLWPSSDDFCNKHYLVPSMLQTLPPNKISDLVRSAKLPSLFLKFDTGRVPPGLFPRFVLEYFGGVERNFPA